jgi:hypothetical protein
MDPDQSTSSKNRSRKPSAAGGGKTLACAPTSRRLVAANMGDDVKAYGGAARAHGAPHRRHGGQGQELLQSTRVTRLRLRDAGARCRSSFLAGRKEEAAANVPEAWSSPPPGRPASRAHPRPGATLIAAGKKGSAAAHADPHPAAEGAGAADEAML